MSSQEDVTKKFENLIKLSELKEPEQVIKRLEWGYFPFAGFVFENNLQEGRALLAEYVAWLDKAKNYIKPYLESEE